MNLAVHTRKLSTHGSAAPGLYRILSPAHQTEGIYSPEGFFSRPGHLKYSFGCEACMVQSQALGAFYWETCDHYSDQLGLLSYGLLQWD